MRSDSLHGLEVSLCSNFLDPPWGPHSLVLSRQWRLFSQELSGRRVNLITHICLVPSLRMSGAVLPVFLMHKLRKQGLSFLHIFRRFCKLLKIDYKLHVRPPVRMELGSCWKDFHQSLYKRIFRKSIKIQVLIKLNQNMG